MYIRLLIVLLFLLTGCSNQDVNGVEGKISTIDQDSNQIIIYLGDSLTKEEKTSMNFDEHEEKIEAFAVNFNQDTTINGEVSQIDELTQGQKVEVSLKGEYKTELVSYDTFTHEQDQLPSYDVEQIKVLPYTMVDLEDTMTVDKGYYGIYIYNSNINNDPVYESMNEPPFESKIQSVNIIMEPREGYINESELLGLEQNETTYILTDHNGIVLKTNSVEEVEKFFVEVD
ncbi:hypothetical protein ACTWQB_05625 [Piscibacillus sp. B03]|uniref:hypothetical protein n=1 Tax=Piscibacillus sp. B03 TaxID=3457430 RepID=UPI003FCD6A42